MVYSESFISFFFSFSFSEPFIDLSFYFVGKEVVEPFSFKMSDRECRLLNRRCVRMLQSSLAHRPIGLGGFWWSLGRTYPCDFHCFDFLLQRFICRNGFGRGPLVASCPCSFLLGLLQRPNPYWLVFLRSYLIYTAAFIGFSLRQLIIIVSTTWLRPGSYLFLVHTSIDLSESDRFPTQPVEHLLHLIVFLSKEKLRTHVVNGSPSEHRDTLLEPSDLRNAFLSCVLRFSL